MRGRDSTAPSRVVVEYGNRRFEVELSYSKRERLTISVHPDMRVTAAAPHGQQEEDIARRIRKRARWIAKQFDRLERFRALPTPQQFVSGATLWYLGRQYRLKVSRGEGEDAKLVGRFLWIAVSDKSDRARIKNLVDAWYRAHARAMFSRKIEAVSQRAGAFGVPGPSSWQVRRMRNRWGSCGQSGRLLLNIELIKAPISAIEYVIAHELCHLKELNHTPKFYRLLGGILPDWKARKEKLDRFVV